jgi:hypothetical protein
MTMKFKMYVILGLSALVAANAPNCVAGSLVAPNANASAPGNSDNRFPFFTAGGMAYQQVFAASQFSAFGGPQSINEIDFRNGIFVNEAFTTTIANIQISLSTTSKAPDGLSSTFADNVGSDSTVVYSGALTLSSTNAAGPGGTHVFDIAIHFQNDFVYNPASGNLLLSIDNISGADSSIVGKDYLDAINNVGDSVSRVFGPEGDPTSTGGTADSLGLIAQFEYGAASVPEPSSLTLLALGAVGMAFTAGRLRKTARVV